MDDDFDDFGLDTAVLASAVEEAERRAGVAQNVGGREGVAATGGGSDGGGAGGGVQQPLPQKISRSTGTSAVLVSTRQKGNPVLNYIKKVPWEYGEIIPDYVVGQTACVLFLSLKYHKLHPEYIYNRIKLLQHTYSLRILLIHVDIDAHQPALLELTKTCHINSLTLILSWSSPEAARYLETFKTYENTPPTLIREKQKSDYTSRMIDVVTAVRSVNKTDAVAMVSNFGSVRGAMNAEVEELVLVQGWGERKAGRWVKSCREGFKVRRGGAGSAERVEEGEGRGQEAAAGMGMDRDLASRLGVGPVILPEGMMMTQGEGSGHAVHEIEDDDEDALVAEMEMRKRRRKGGTGDTNPPPPPPPPPPPQHEKIMDALANLRKQ